MTNIQQPDDELSDWTFPRLKQIGPDQLRARTGEAQQTNSISKLLFGRCLLAIDETRPNWLNPYSSSIHYANFLGASRREANEARRVARETERLPELKGALESGQISFSKAREISRKATPETERIWVELGQRYGYHEIEQLVSWTAAGAVPDPENLTRQDPAEAEIRVKLPTAMMQLWKLCLQELCHKAGRRLALIEIFEALIAEVLVGEPFPSAAVREKLLARASKDVAAREQAERREVTQMLKECLEAENPFLRECKANEDSGDEVANETNSRQSKSSYDQPHENLASAQVCAEVVHWENNRLRFSGETRALTPAQREEMIRRDGCRCSTPGCQNDLWLQVHHIIFQSHGGATIPANLLTLCSKCHSNLHNGYLILFQTPTGSLRWTDDFGRRLGESCLSHGTVASTGQIATPRASGSRPGRDNRQSRDSRGC